MLENVEYVKADLLSNDIESLSPNEFKSTSSTETTKIAVEPSAEKVEISMVHNMDDNPYWILDCLEDAKSVIMEYHDEKPDDKNFTDCTKFLASRIFEIKLQNNGNASGYVDLIEDRNNLSYKIYVHDLFIEDTRNNRRMLTIILLHQLLHAIHPSRMHDFTNGQKGINRIEHELANRASYHDALLNLESLHQSGKLRLCNVI